MMNKVFNEILWNFTFNKEFFRNIFLKLIYNSCYLLIRNDRLINNSEHCTFCFYCRNKVQFLNQLHYKMSKSIHINESRSKRFHINDITEAAKIIHHQIKTHCISDFIFQNLRSESEKRAF